MRNTSLSLVLNKSRSSVINLLFLVLKGLFLLNKQSCIQVWKVRSDHALPLKYFSKLFDVYQLKKSQLYLTKFGMWILWWGELRSYCHVFQEVWFILTRNKSGRFHHLYSSHLFVGTTKNIFQAQNGVHLVTSISNRQALQ